MKKTLLLITLISISTFAQQKTTGLVNLLSNTTATLLLDNSAQTATLTLSGPNDRWFALQFGSFADDSDGMGGGMGDGLDLVYWNNVTLVDASHNGIGIAPTPDATNNWTFISNTDNSPSTGLRTIVFSRPFNTGDANDYQFNFNDSSIDFAFARRSSAGYTLNSHGFSNRGYAVDVSLTTLGVEDFSLNATQIYPNPSNGEFLIKAKTTLREVNVYSQTGTFVKTIKVEESDTTEINIKGIQTGVYLLELVNATEKSWKKIIVN